MRVRGVDAMPVAGSTAMSRLWEKVKGLMRTSNIENDNYRYAETAHRAEGTKNVVVGSTQIGELNLSSSMEPGGALTDTSTFNPYNVGSSSVPVYFKDGVPVEATGIPSGGSTANISYGTTDLTAGESELADGALYFVYVE